MDDEWKTRALADVLNDLPRMGEHVWTGLNDQREEQQFEWSTQGKYDVISGKKIIVYTIFLKMYTLQVHNLA